MIVEFFGPPGVGKTTFASALVAALRERGCTVDSVVSYRPEEHSSSSGSPSGLASQDPARRQTMAAMRRVLRPLVETLAVVQRSPGKAHEVGTPAGLIRLLPPRSLIWSVRLHQYLLRLFRSWDQAASANHVVLFDQAFVQALCSLAVLGRASDRKQVAVALDAVPKPDLLVRLGAAHGVLEARLRARQQRQSRMEQLLELDLQTNLGFIEIVEGLHGLLRDRGQPVTCVDSTDQDTLREGVARTEADIMAMLNARQAVAKQAVPA